MLATNDQEIRAALHHKKLRSYQKAGSAIIVDELGLSHAKVRIDVAVISAEVHGFEIKSSLDTLDRLPGQLGFYSKGLSRLTLVCADKHLAKAERIVPDWCGLILAEKGSRGGITFETVRRARANPSVDAIQVAHLLWHSEAAELLAGFGASPRELKRSRLQLYIDLAAQMPIADLIAAIRKFMAQRSTWRDQPAHA
ncbi:sce7726 family protein [Agrobacterium fabrum]|uniref:sce7726 family protein n=1 Tax=Agrobacterium fabrum TaxID=1176649 RepID=UPI0015717D74|nr:sce7726 family protein [Agrobacterium fabrum]WCK80147.1 sce7726 family protein [Agrobacterium fabrum]